MLFLYVALLIFFTGTLYGTEQSLNAFAKASSIFTVYTRGVGKFDISLVNMYLVLFMIFSFFSLFFLKTRNKIFASAPSYCIAFLAFFYIAYSMYGLLSNINFNNVVSLHGGIGLLNIFMMYVVVRISLKNADDVYGLEKVFFICCLLMAIYGLLRLPLGGDPANYYGLFEKKNVRLTFFDFGQAAVFSVAFSLLFLRQGGKLMKSFTGAAMAILFLANILLSYRRTAWLGLFLIFLWFLLILDVKRKFFILALGFMVFTAGTAVYSIRFIGSAGTNGGTAQKLLSADITDKSGKISFTKGRFSELYAAVMAVNSSPLVGLGPWGVNTSFTRERDSAPASFVHSSIVHVYLKMGLLGLAAYLGLLIGFPLWWFRQRLRTWNDPRLRTIGDAFFCGYLFWLPDIWFGTPLIIYRHTQLLALFFAVPAAAWAIDSRIQQEKKLGRFAPAAFAALALFIMMQTPDQAAAATNTAPQPELDSVSTAAPFVLQAEISIGKISETIISPLLIGTNLHVGYERDIDSNPKKNQLLNWQPGEKVVLNTEMLGHCRNMGIKILRFPGGETSNAYHWREGVGPVQTRPVGKDEYGVAMKLFLGTLEFAEAAKAIGAETLITVNYKNGSAQEAANWVEYCNGIAPVGQTGWREQSYAADEAAPAGYFAWLRARHGHKEPLGVRYWEIGNEIYFHKESGYIANAERFSSLMKKKDPSIKIGLSSDSLLYMSPKAIRSLKIPPESFDFLAVHYYGVLNSRRPQTNFYSNAESSRSFVVDSAGTYQISIEASGSKALEWPHMSLEVNGMHAQDFTVSSPIPQSYATHVQFNQGINSLALKFTNDRSLPGIGDCNLFVQGVTYTTPKAPPVEIWNTPALEYAWLFANNRLIEEHVDMVRQAFPRLPLMITEGNTGYGIIKGLKDAEESRKLKAGLWMAGLLNSLIRKDVSTFAQWALQGSHMGFALVWPNGHALPSSFALKMFSIHAGQRRVDLAITSPSFDTPLLETTSFGKATTGNPFVDGVASLNEKESELAITMVNRHAHQPIQTKISLGDLRAIVPKATLDVLKDKNNEGMEASNESIANNVGITTKSMKFDSEAEMILLTLEPSSITTFRIDIRR
jgi:alpha-L-arabinofuranosidase